MKKPGFYDPGFFVSKSFRDQVQKLWGSKNLAESQNRKVLMKKQKKTLRLYNIFRNTKRESRELKDGT
ncbi:hypothetical protein AB674_02465 [Flavobacterium sp. ABG]|nr:hypothetical protein AB674_02465 [Flavobacterium sp. ABG]